MASDVASVAQGPLTRLATNAGSKHGRQGGRSDPTASCRLLVAGRAAARGSWFWRWPRREWIHLFRKHWWGRLRRGVRGWARARTQTALEQPHSSVQAAGFAASLGIARGFVAGYHQVGPVLQRRGGCNAGISFEAYVPARVNLLWLFRTDPLAETGRH